MNSISAPNFSVQRLRAQPHFVENNLQKYHILSVSMLGKRDGAEQEWPGTYEPHSTEDCLQKHLNFPMLMQDKRWSVAQVSGRVKAALTGG